MRKLAMLIFIIILAILNVSDSHADDTDLFILNVQPEVLIILDMSGSMNWDSAGSPAEYPDRRIDIARGVIYDLLDNNDDGKESNNDPRFIDKTDEETLNVRIGYMRFRGVGEADNDDGDPKTGDIIVFNETEIGESYRQIWEKVSDPNETATGCTPLAASLVEAGIYYRDYINPSDTAKACRQKFIILITDGSDTVACSGDCSENAPDMWKRRYLTVLRAKNLYTPPAGDLSNPNIVPIQVFAIGFGGSMPEQLKTTLNWVAKYGGTNNPLEDDSGDPNAYDITRYPGECDVTDSNADPAKYSLSGYAFLVEDATQLSKALKTIVKYVQEKSYSYTAPSVPTVRLVDGDTVYISSFTPDNTPFWQGNIKAFRLKPDGSLELDDNGNPINPLWDAFDELKGKSANDRKILTYVNNNLNNFNLDNLSNADLGVNTDADRANLISHIRGGADPYDVNRNGITSEPREWKLGDIFHSNAVIVGEPSRFFEDICFNRCPDGSDGFYQVNKSRTKVIIVGANDGMLHAFNATSGSEEWAFIPSSLLKNLKSMTSAHTYYVDSSPKVADVWLYSDSNPSGQTKTKGEWKTVLVSGLRKGGKHYFALNITDTLDPKYLWEFPRPTDSEILAKLGQSWSEPAIGRVKIKVGNEIYERWVAFIGGGFDKTNVVGKAFFVIDIKTGDIIKEFSGLSGMDYSLAAPPTAVDSNFNGYVDKVYIGDLAGQMWVFDISSNDIAQWTGKILFRPLGTPAEKRPLYYQPAVAFDSRRTPWVYFGSGDRENPSDKNSKEKFYAVKDDGIGPYPRTENNLKDVTVYSDRKFLPPQEPLKGWYIRLAMSEKVLAKPAVFYNLLYFTTYTYTSDDPCQRAGDASFYVVEYLSGGGALVLDDYLQGIPTTRSVRIGEGIPSAPVISVDLHGKATVTIGTTSGRITTKQAFSPSNTKEILYWREVNL